jgi:exonuclease III
MKIFSWNYRGVGRAPTVRTIKALACYEGLDILFLAETKVDTPRIDSINRRLGFANFFNVDCSSRAGGLALF